MPNKLTDKINLLRDNFFLKVRPFVDWAKRVTLPGFDKMPLYDVAIAFWRSMNGIALTTRAAAVAFNLIMAIFPAIIFLFTLIPILPIHNFQQELLDVIASIVPDSIYEVIQSTIEDIITRPHSGLLSAGFLIALFFSTNGCVSIISAFNSSVNVTETRPWWAIRLVALLLVLIITVLLTVGISLITFTQSVLNMLVHNGIMNRDITYYIITFGKWIIIIAIFYFAYSFLFYLAPARKSKYRFISVGGTLSTILSIIISIGFNFYIDKFSNYNALYGSIGTLPIIMLMLYLNCLAILVGFELNAGIVATKRTLDL